jgi:hypothetical protein
MAIDFNAFLNRKYDIMEQEAVRPAAQAAPQTINVSAGMPSSGPSQPPEDKSDSFGVRDMPSSTSTLDKVGIDAARRYGNSFDLNLKKGIARVPGKGDGTKDTVKAKLAPGEAVLNKAAADGMGRGLIAALNKMGAKKMGMV